MLLSKIKASNLVIPTKLLKWYVEHGIRVNNLYQLLWFSAGRPFKEWGEKLAQKRRDAAEEGSTVHEMTAKFMGNSAYGMALFNPLK